MKLDLRQWRGVGFVQRAPTRSGEDVELRITKMTASHVLWWHSHVQPAVAADPKRVDQHWNWLLYVPFASLVGGVLNRRPTGFTVGLVDHAAGQLVPCALVQLVGRYPSVIEKGKRSVLVWYLSTAPDQALLDVDDLALEPDRLPKRLGTIGLDVAVTHSFNRHRRGRVVLHAAPKGGDVLLGWYQSHGMRVLPEGERIPFPRQMVEPSDGRYCYFTTKTALAFSRSLDPLR